MRFYTATTRYQAVKANPDCFAFCRVEGGWLCFFDAETLRVWRTQR